MEINNFKTYSCAEFEIEIPSTNFRQFTYTKIKRTIDNDIVSWYYFRYSVWHPCTHDSPVHEIRVSTLEKAYDKYIRQNKLERILNV